MFKKGYTTQTSYGNRKAQVGVWLVGVGGSYLF